jgi:integrase
MREIEGVEIPKSAGRLGRDGQLTRPKTDRSMRTIRVGSDLRRELLAYYMSSTDKAPGAFVFAHYSAAPPEYHNARRALVDAIEEAGIVYDSKTHRVGFHGFRHGAVSALIKAGADPARVARYVGDKIETILSTYTQWEAQADDNLGDLLGNAMSTAGAGAR